MGRHTESFLEEFVNEQLRLMNNKSTAVPANKNIVRPETAVIATEPSLEDMYNHILEKKPAKKKVQDFLQKLIDKIIEEDEF